MVSRGSNVSSRQKLKKSVLMTKPAGAVVNVSSGQVAKSPATTQSVLVTSHALAMASMTMASGSVQSNPKLSVGRVADTKVTASSRSSPTPQSKVVTARKSPIPQNKQWTDAKSSPTHLNKKIPTILEYADNSKKYNTIPLLGSDKKTSPLLSPGSKMSAAAVEKTFQHCISDLIRDALESHNVVTKPRVEISKQPQVPKITLPISTGETFMGQFAQFASSGALTKAQSQTLNQSKPSVQYPTTNQEEALKMLANQAHGMKKVPTQGQSSVKRLSDQGQHVQVSNQSDIMKKMVSQRADMEQKHMAKSFKQQAVKSFEEEKHRTQLIQQTLAKQNIQMQKTTEGQSLLHKQLGQTLQPIPHSRPDRNISNSKADSSAAIQNMITCTGASHSLLQSYPANAQTRGLSRTAAIVSENLGNRGLQTITMTSPSSQVSHSQAVYRSSPQTAHSSRTSSELTLNLLAADNSLSSKSAQDLSTSSREPFSSILQKFYCQSDKSLSLSKPLPSPGLQSPGVPSPALPSPSLSLSMAETSLPQMKSMAAPAWSSLLGSTASTTVSTMGYTSQYSLPKPVAGYQSVKLTNHPRDPSTSQPSLHLAPPCTPGEK